MQGTIKTVNFERGFGFIETAVAGPDVFFHMSGLADGVEFDQRLTEMRVEYDEEFDARSGKSRAVNVRPAR